MTDWSEKLGQALMSGDPAYMKAMLTQVPSGVLHRAIPYIEQLARQTLEQGRFDEALTFLDQLLALSPERGDWLELRARAHAGLQRPAEALADARHSAELQPRSASAQRQLAQMLERSGDLAQALAVYRTLLELEPGKALEGSIAALETKLRNQSLIDGLLKEPGAEPAPAPPALPTITFDPALLRDPALPADADTSMVEGLTRHLQRYSNLQSSRNVLARLEDPAWLAAWDAALAQTRGGNVLFIGGGLGVLPLRSLAQGARRCLVIETQPLDARIGGGVTQKNLLTQWHAEHAAERDAMSADEKRASFEALAAAIAIVPPDAPEIAAFAADWIVCSEIDHTLLGLAIVPTLRRHAAHALAAGARVLPCAARLFVQAVQWHYPGAGFDLQPVEELRWSPYPEALELPPESWIALSEPVPAGDIDFATFTPGEHEIALPLTRSGRVDGYLFWFELDLGGGTTLSSAVGAGRALRPALQHGDAEPVRAGEVHRLVAHVTDTRVWFESATAQRRPRSARLPSWYAPMLIDAGRNAAYRAALDAALRDRRDALVLDIGAGCGLLSLMAAAAGAQHVVACEVRPSLCRVGEAVAARNGHSDAIRFVAKDLRRLSVPDDLPRRADLAVFEMFDCSLIGEGVLHFLAYAREHLLAPDAQYVPYAAVLRAMIVEYRVERMLGVDVNLLNPYRFSPEFINVDASQAGIKALSAPFDVFAVDFASATPAAYEVDVLATATASGTAGAVLFWFDLEIERGRWLSNAPGAPERLHWKQGLQFLPEVQVAPQMPLPLQARHNGSSLGFRWKDAELPQKAFSQLPRVDPRVWKQASEMEAQTQQLLQHCAAHADEYAKVAELAKRIAVDPAAHGVDAQIAQRFVSTFFRD